MDEIAGKVIKGLQSEIDTAIYYGHSFKDCVPVSLLQNALSLLKGQEPVSPKVDIDTYVCGSCGTRLERQSLIGPNAVLAETFNYCPNCGRKVKWE